VKRHLLTTEQARSAIDLYESGLPVSRIAQRIGRRTTGGLNALQRNGVRMRARGRSPEHMTVLASRSYSGGSPRRMAPDARRTTVGSGEAERD
jgi:hypothetical protein